MVKLTLIGILGMACAFGQTTSTANNDNSTSGTSLALPAPAPITPAISTQRPIFLSGIVMMDDGSALPGDVSIQSLCGTIRRTMGHTSSSKGTFSFQWTPQTVPYSDASQIARTPTGNGPSALTGMRNGSRGNDPLAICELMAEAPGYSSGRASLANRSGQENFDVGPIILHRVVPGEGHTVSVLALQAPKDAKRSFDKGTALTAAHKPTEALASFMTAVTIYPGYSDAWLSMGKVQWELGYMDEARESFEKSIELDGKLVGPWQELGYLACDEARWEDAVRYLDQAVRLDPMDSAIAWYFDALANYNLGRFERAERYVRTELKLDRGANPRAGYLLGMVLLARQDLPGAADALRNYIASAPKSTDVTTAKRELSRVESTLGR